MSSINIEKISIVYWYSDLEKHKCGYCKNENGAVSYGMWAQQLTVEDYQNLIDRGWRRSGMYCYKPMMDQTCCPQYTIRCSAPDFHLSKSQKKIIKKFNKFVNDGIGGNKENNLNESSTEHADDDAPQEQIIIKERPSITMDFAKRLTGSDSDSDMPSGDFQGSQIASNNTESSVKEMESSAAAATVNPANVQKGSSGSFKEGDGADPNKPLCKKAKLLRLERRQRKLLEKGMNVEKESSSSEAKSLEQFLNEISSNSKHKLKIKHEHVNKNHSTFKTCAALFKKYQMAVHNEPPNECGESQFREFLVDTPLKTVRVRTENSVVTFGTFHQQYWLDDKLIAVAVLDILPRCVSSVYFFYDPDYRFLTLGTYGSLREVQFVQSLYKNLSAIKYYYMGYYIHSCPKMRYKGKLSYSYLLCPETYQWFSFDKCVVKLEVNKYARLNDDANAIDENACTAIDVDRIKVLLSYTLTEFGNYKQRFGEQEIFDNVGRLIGKKCAATLLFVKN